MYNIRISTINGIVPTLSHETAEVGTKVDVGVPETYDDTHTFGCWEVVTGNAVLEDSGNASTSFIMPEGDVILRAAYNTESIEPLISVSVKNGLGAWNYAPGEVVWVILNEHPEGYGVRKWVCWHQSGELSLDDPSSPITYFIVPSYATADQRISVIATYEDGKYTVRCNTNNSTLRYNAGDIVEYGNASDFNEEHFVKFSHWTIEPEVEFIDNTDEYSDVIKFVMPESDVTIKANTEYVNNGLPVKINIITDGDGSGTVSSLPEITPATEIGKDRYGVYNILLKATADVGSRFGYWEVPLIHRNCIHNPHALEASFGLPSANDLTELDVRAVFFKTDSAVPMKYLRIEYGYPVDHSQWYDVYPGESKYIGIYEIDIPDGYIFSHWECTGDSIIIHDPEKHFTKVTVVECNKDDVIVAVLKENPGKYEQRVYVGGALKSANGSGIYKTGDKVYINASTKSPIANKKFYRWTSDNPNVIFDNQYDYVTSFIMPEDRTVVVNAEFVDRHVVYIDEVRKSSINRYPGSVVDISFIKYGDISFGSWSSNPEVVLVDGTTLTSEHIKFIMPDSDVDLIANVYGLGRNRKLTVYGRLYGSEEDYVLDNIEIDPPGGYCPAGIQVYLNSKRNSGYLKWEVISGDAVLDYEDRYQTTFIMPDSDVEIRMIHGDVPIDESRSFSYSNAYGRIIDRGGSSRVGYASKGDNVELIKYGLTPPGYIPSEWVSSWNDMIRNPMDRDLVLTLSHDSDNIISRKYKRYTPSTYQEPSSEVFVNGSLSNHNGSGKYNPGDKVVVNALNPALYMSYRFKKFYRWTSDNPNVIFDNQYDYVTSFIMPEDKFVVINAEFKETHEVHVKITNDGRRDVIYAVEGEVVNITATKPTENAVFSQWDIFPAVEFTNGTDEQSETISFIMPSNNVRAEGTYDESTISSVLHDVILSYKIPEEYADVISQKDICLLANPSKAPAGSTVTIGVNNNICYKWNVVAGSISINTSDNPAQFIMPDNDVKIKMISEINRLNTNAYVVNGSISNKVITTSILEYRIIANEPPAGYKFSHWICSNSLVTYDDMYSDNTNAHFEILNNYITYQDVFPYVVFEPVYVKDSEYKYEVIINGISDGVYSDRYATGETVKINAGSKFGYNFSHWETDGVTLTNSNVANTTFDMPANDVTITAIWNEVIIDEDTEYIYPSTTIYVHELDKHYSARPSNKIGIWVSQVELPSNETSDVIVYTLEVYVNGSPTGLIERVTVKALNSQYYEVGNFIVDTNELDGSGGIVIATVEFKIPESGSANS